MVVSFSLQFITKMISTSYKLTYQIFGINFNFVQKTRLQESPQFFNCSTIHIKVFTRSESFATSVKYVQVGKKNIMTYFDVLFLSTQVLEDH